MNACTAAAGLEALPAHLSDMPIEAPRPQWPGYIRDAAEQVATRLPGLAAELRAIAAAMSAEDVAPPAAAPDALTQFDLLTLLKDRVCQMEALFASIFHEAQGEENSRLRSLSALGMDVAESAEGDLCEPVLAAKRRYDAQRAGVHS